MRYANYAYAHACSRLNDPNRGAALDSKAQAEGYASTPDYIDNVQGRENTRSFQTSDGRTCWSNQEAGLYGWNNSSDPSKSTVVPSRNPDRNFENQKEDEAQRQGLENKNDLQEIGPIPEEQRQAADHGVERDSSIQNSETGYQPEQSTADSPALAPPPPELPPPPPPPPPPPKAEQAQSQGR